MNEEMDHIIKKIKKDRPLILNITNMVTMDFVANGLLCLGASPIMSLAVEEIDSLANIASAIVINIGTLNSDFITLTERAAFIANQLQKPLILDPVGAGATAYRTETALNLINRFKFDIIRGNASEIGALAGIDMTTKGVDSTIDGDAVLGQAKQFAKQYNTVLSVSGETDFIIDKSQVLTNQSGSPLMPMITGTGCLLTAVTAAFRSMDDNSVKAALAASQFYGQCGEKASSKTSAPGSFKEAFLDELFNF